MATAELVPRDKVAGNVVLKDLAVAPIADLIASLIGATDEKAANDPLPSDGTFSGNAEFSVPLDTAGEVATYQLDGKFSGRGLRVSSLPPTDFDAKRVRIENERLLVDDFSLTARSDNRSSDAIRLLGNATLPLSADGEFSFEVFGDDIPLGTVVSLINQQSSKAKSNLVTGKVDFRVTGDGQVDKTIAGSNWNIRGSVASPSLKVAGVDLGTLEHEIELTPAVFNIVPKRDVETLPKSFRLGMLKSNYAINDESLVIEQFDATLFQGKASGSATIPFVESGIAIAKVNINEMQPSIELAVAGRTIEVSAGIDGQIDWRVPISAVDQPNQHSGQADLSLTKILIGSESIGELKAVASADAGKISLDADGTLFDGNISVQTVANMQANDRWTDLPTRLAETVLKFDDVAVEQIFETATATKIDVSGLASGAMTVVNWNMVDDSRNLLPEVDINAQLSRFSHRSRLLSRSASIGRKAAQQRF